MEIKKEILKGKLICKISEVQAKDGSSLYLPNLYVRTPHKDVLIKLKDYKDIYKIIGCNLHDIQIELGVGDYDFNE